jgi:hypothetical protein
VGRSVLFEDLKGEKEEASNVPKKNGIVVENRGLMEGGAVKKGFWDASKGHSGVFKRRSFEGTGRREGTLWPQSEGWSAVYSVWEELLLLLLAHCLPNVKMSGYNAPISTANVK